MNATSSDRTENIRARRESAKGGAEASPVRLLRRAYGKGRIGLALACAMFALAAPTALQAATLVVHLRDVVTFAPFGDSSNIVSFYDIGARSEVVGLAFDLNIFADDPSWLSEPTIHITNSNISAGFGINPGVNEEHPGNRHYSDSADLTELGFNFRVGDDGLLRLEYSDSFDDFVDEWDGVFNGTLTFTYNPMSAVPEPATWATLVVGFGLAGAWIRRRPTRSTAAFGGSPSA